MSNINIEVLENTIAAYIDSAYKEIPPTEKEFLDQAITLRANMSSICLVSDEEFENILAHLRSRIVIQMEIGIYINDRNRGHQSWLPARRAELDFFYWNRYKIYLEQKKHWNPRVIASLDRVSDEIMDLLGDPLETDGFQRRGLVLGDVQSGKTANYTAICNKAADTGYRIIIILAGTMENLRRQTQERLDAEFSGRRSEYFLDPKAGTEIRNTPVGVGRYGTRKRIASFTSVAKDFDINVLKSNDLALQSVSDPVVFVVKKNKRILTNLFNWLVKNSVSEKTGKVMLPLLLVDDEADNASVNTKDPEESPAAINACIRRLLNCFYQASYLGITATPFANIFIDPDSEDEMIGDDLFPRDFIYALRAPTNYIGAEQIFGEEGSFSKVLVPLDSAEMEMFIPLQHKKDHEISELPPSLFEASAYFLLTNAIRDARGDTTEHRSMMVHISRFTAIQNHIMEMLNEWLLQVKSDLKNYSQLDPSKSELIENILFLKKVWEKYDLSTISHISWRHILQEYLFKAVAPIDVRAVNQQTGSASLDYFNHKETGFRVIAVGGNSLSRGLTLEGLCVSYFYRKSQMYDTLLQMGRWFGYRPGYEDLFKIWIAEEAIDWYGYITNAAEELKLEIAKMKAANQTPSDFGLKVRQDPNSLIATARNKMRTAKPVSRPITVSGRLLETPRLKASPQIIIKNETVFKEFVDSLAEIGQQDLAISPFYWHGVPKEAVAQLLYSFETHPWHLAFQGRALAEYIEEKMEDQPWDVTLVASGEGKAYPDSLKYGSDIIEIDHTERRGVIADDKMIRISGTKVKVGAGGCTRVGLTPDQIEQAVSRFRAQNGAKNIPDSAYLIQERAPLLMLHIIDVDLDTSKSTNTNIPAFLYALGVGFPDNGGGISRANYVVNIVELRNWMDPDEENDE
jgi:hypothetical protein